MLSKVVTGERAASLPVLSWTRVTLNAPADTQRRQPEDAPPDAEAGKRAAELEARVAELERRVVEARQEGQRAGEKAGHDRAKAELEPVYKRLGQTIEELARFRSRFRREAEEDLVKLALAVARRILHREITVDPEALTGIVKAALDRLDAREIHRVHVHPLDAPAVQRHFTQAGLPSRIEVVADASLERGGVIFETTHGNLDASVETQLQEIQRGFVDLVHRRP